MLLRDVGDLTSLEVNIETLPSGRDGSTLGIEIKPKGYGDNTSADGYGCPVFLELNDGKLMLYVWADINQEDPTHTICLDGAKESARQQDTCPGCGAPVEDGDVEPGYCGSTCPNCRADHAEVCTICRADFQERGLLSEDDDILPAGS